AGAAQELDHRRALEDIVRQARLELALRLREVAFVPLDDDVVAAVTPFAAARPFHSDEDVHEDSGDQDQRKAFGAPGPDQRQAAQAEHQSEVSEDVAHRALETSAPGGER